MTGGWRGDRLAVFGQHLICLHRRMLPATWPCDDRHDAGLAGCLALLRDLHFLPVVVGGPEVAAERQPRKPLYADTSTSASILGPALVRTIAKS